MTGPERHVRKPLQPLGGQPPVLVGLCEQAIRFLEGIARQGNQPRPIIVVYYLLAICAYPITSAISFSDFMPAGMG